MTDSYPERDQFYAHRFVRVLCKSCAAMDIGQGTCLLLCFIAHTEDSTRYSGPVRFWNEQLMTTMGWKSPKQLNDARQRAIDAGWLVYHREGHRQVGRYWVTIPEAFEDISDAPIEPIRSEYGMNSGTNKERIAERIGNGLRNEKVTESGKPSIPIPIPNPLPNKEGETQSADASPATEKMQEVLSEFDSHFGTSSRLTANRIKALKARLKDLWWCDNWRTALDRGSGSAFLRGANDRGWTIDFEFFLRPDTATKILEGKYDDRQGAQQRPSNAQAREQRTSSAFDRIREAARAASGSDGSSLPAPGTRTLVFREDDT